MNFIPKLRGSRPLRAFDQFCGCGGSSFGAESAGIEIAVAMNHWLRAVETYQANHPNALVDCANISACDPSYYPGADILITSPECKYHGRGRGQARPTRQLHLWEKQKSDPKADRSRATMWDVPRYAEEHLFDLIVVENVVEVRCWLLFEDWLKAMTTLGYDHEMVYFNSMFAHLDPNQVTKLDDFAPQSRDRIYIVFWKKGNKKPDLEFRPRAWCGQCAKDVESLQTWKNTEMTRRFGGRWGCYGEQYFYTCPDCRRQIEPYRFAAFNVIDWSLPIERIGDRKKPLKPKTIERIKRGLEKFGGQCLTIEMAYTQDAGGHSRLATDPLYTQTSRQTQGLIFPPALSIRFRNNQDGESLADPMGTITAGGGHHGLLMPFLSVAYSPGYNRPITEPMGTVTTEDHHGLVAPPFLMSYYGENPGYRETGEAMGTITTVDRHALVMPMPFYLGYANSNGPAHPVTHPMLTIHTEPGHGLVVPTAEECYFRMFQPREVGRGQAFPDTYIILGTKKEQVKQIGNAVSPPVMKQIIARGAATLE